MFAPVFEKRIMFFGGDTNLQSILSISFLKLFPNLSILLNMFMLYFIYEMRTTDVVKVERENKGEGGRRSKIHAYLTQKKIVVVNDLCGCYFVYV